MPELLKRRTRETSFYPDRKEPAKLPGILGGSRLSQNITLSLPPQEESIPENVFENALERIEKKLNWEVNTGCSPAYLNFTGVIEDVLRKSSLKKLQGLSGLSMRIPCKSA